MTYLAGTKEWRVEGVLSRKPQSAQEYRSQGHMRMVKRFEFDSMGQAHSSETHNGIGTDHKVNKSLLISRKDSGVVFQSNKAVCEPKWKKRHSWNPR